VAWDQGTADDQKAEAEVRRLLASPINANDAVKKKGTGMFSPLNLASFCLFLVQLARIPNPKDACPLFLLTFPRA
jgi:hypothetical protein